MLIKAVAELSVGTSTNYLQYLLSCSSL